MAFAIQAGENAAKATRKAADEKRAREDADFETDRANRNAADEKRQRQRGDAELERARAHLFTAQLARVDALWERDPILARDLLHDRNACPIDRRDLAWHIYNRVCNREIATFGGHTHVVHSVSLSGDGKTLASGDMDGTVKVWDVATG